MLPHNGRQCFASNPEQLAQLLGQHKGPFKGAGAQEKGQCRIYTQNPGDLVNSINETLNPQVRQSGHGSSSRGSARSWQTAAETPLGDLGPSEAEDPPDDSHFSPLQLGRGIESCFSGPAQRQYAQEREARARHWKARLPASTAAMISSAPAINELLLGRAQLLLQQQQAACGRAADLHACHAVLGKESPAVVSIRTVTVISLGSMQKLEVPTYHCSTCSTRWEAMPESIDCFPSAPQSGHYWIDSSLLRMFRELTTGPSGCSATAFVAAINATNSDDSSASLDDRIFFEAYQHYRHAARPLSDPTAMGAQDLDAGAFGHCPACAIIPGQHPPSRLAGADTCQLRQAPQL